MKSKITFLILLAITFRFIAISSEFSIDKAKKINIFLKKIAKKKKPSIFLKKRTFTESELNSYFNIFYVKKYAPEVKYIKFKLKKKNRVSGTMKVKLVGKKYEKVPSFLRNFEIEFNGKIECENYRMRYIIEELRVNGTTFSPELLDEAFNTAQTNFKVKKSIFDWFNLLPGIKSVLINHKMITFFY